MSLPPSAKESDEISLERARRECLKISDMRVPLHLLVAVDAVPEIFATDDIVKLTGLDRRTVWYHLSKLRRCGFVQLVEGRKWRRVQRITDWLRERAMLVHLLLGTGEK